MEPLDEYNAANEAFDKAYAEYQPIRDAYTDRSIPLEDRPTDEQFLAAKAKFDVFAKRYDEAYEKMQNSD